MCTTKTSFQNRGLAAKKVKGGVPREALCFTAHRRRAGEPTADLRSRPIDVQLPRPLPRRQPTGTFGRSELAGTHPLASVLGQHPLLLLTDHLVEIVGLRAAV